MTEQEWLTCTDPRPMLEFLKGKASIRKLRLFCCACCLRVAPLLTEDYVRHALQAITLFEQHLEGLVSDQMVHEVSSKVIADSMDAANAIAHPGEADYYAISAAAATVEFSLRNNVTPAADWAAKAVAYNFLAKSSSPTSGQISSEWTPINRPPGYGRERWDRDEERMSSIPEYKHAQDAEQRLQCSLLRDIFGNPSAPSPSPHPGSRLPSYPSRNRCTTPETSPRCPSSLMHSKIPPAIMSKSSPTVEDLDHT